MDLIYMNPEREDVGILSNYELDIAFGSDENDFECRIAKDMHCCEEGWFFYIENTEYGGVIDQVEVSTEEDHVIYKGRSWHGILEKKVLCPEAGQDYLILDGEANEVLAGLIQQIGLEDLFRVSTNVSDIDIGAYKMERYISAYTGINKMLHEFGAKLKIRFRYGMVELEAVPFIDYSEDEEFDESQIAFRISKDYRPVNHLVCLGQGNLKDRYVIHLFTDEYGEVQPYSITDNPIRDSHYITDTSKQVLFGTDEVCEKYDYSSVETAEAYEKLYNKPDDFDTNFSSYYKLEDDVYVSLTQPYPYRYFLLETAPSDWSAHYGEYYMLSGDNYVKVSSVTSVIYTLQASKPTDWGANYASYYYKSGSAYSNVNDEITTTYAVQKSKPSDWSSNYDKYHTRHSDGVIITYPSVSGVSKSKYKKQTSKPTDWETDFNKYYKKSGSDYVTVAASSKGKAPKWKKNVYYTKYSYQVAPKWKSGTYYTKKETASAPEWKANTYYTQGTTDVPAFEANKYYGYWEIKHKIFEFHDYYRIVYDHYAGLVAGGLEVLKASYDCDSIEIELDSKTQYDIGDIVGASELVTGMGVWQPITKKIVTLRNNDVESISYKIGE